ncbi:MAG: hypothetical protein Q4F00_00845 [bacterium]|nr:hypothetical protein [bacterium]
MFRKHLICASLLISGLFLPVQHPLCAQPSGASPAAPSLMASASAERCPIVVDFSNFYRDTYKQTEKDYIRFNPNETRPSADSLEAWTKEAMPTALSYSRDGGPWSQDIYSAKQQFIIPDQPAGQHGYSLRLTFMSGKGPSYAYTYFKPILGADKKTVLALDGQAVKGMKRSKEITVQLSQKLMQGNPHLLSGQTVAVYEEKEYPVNTQGSFRLTVPFEPPQTLEIHYKSPQNYTLNIYKRDFAVTPQSSSTVVVDMMDVAD